jgi:hypothetical protein
MEIPKIQRKTHPHSGGSKWLIFQPLYRATILPRTINLSLLGNNLILRMIPTLSIGVKVLARERISEKDISYLGSKIIPNNTPNCTRKKILSKKLPTKRWVLIHHGVHSKMSFYYQLR